MRPAIQVPVLLLVDPESLQAIADQITGAVAQAVRDGFALAADGDLGADPDAPEPVHAARL